MKTKIVNKNQKMGEPKTRKNCLYSCKNVAIFSNLVICYQNTTLRNKWDGNYSNKRRHLGYEGNITFDKDRPMIYSISQIVVNNTTTFDITKVKQDINLSEIPPLLICLHLFLIAPI